MRFISRVDRTPEARNVCQDFRASLFLLCECAAWDLPKPGGTRSAFADKQQKRGSVRSILQDAQRHGQRRACWRGSRLAPSPTRRFPCLFWHVTKRATALHHRRRTSANNVSLCPTASSLTRSTAAPPGTFRRAGHAAPCAVGPVARDKGYKAASLLCAPLGPQLAGCCQCPNCAPGQIFAIARFHSCDPIEGIQNIYKATIWRV